MSFACEKCKRDDFTTQVGLNRHTCRICPICKKGFKRKQLLAYHMKKCGVKKKENLNIDFSKIVIEKDEIIKKLKQENERHLTTIANLQEKLIKCKSQRKRKLDTPGKNTWETLLDELLYNIAITDLFYKISRQNRFFYNFAEILNTNNAVYSPKKSKNMYIWNGFRFLESTRDILFSQILSLIKSRLLESDFEYFFKKKGKNIIYRRTTNRVEEMFDLLDFHQNDTSARALKSRKHQINAKIMFSIS